MTQKVKHFRINALRVNMSRTMSTLPDDTYDAFIIDVQLDDERDAIRIELTITSGDHKSDVLAIYATNLERDSIELIGLPARLHVRDGVPRLTFD